MELGWEPESVSFFSQPKLLPVSENETRKCQHMMDETSIAKLQYDLWIYRPGDLGTLRPIKENWIDLYQHSVIQTDDTWIYQDPI